MLSCSRSLLKALRPLSRLPAGSSASTAPMDLSQRLNPQAYNKKSTIEVITSSDLREYLKKYWIVVFGLNTGQLHTQQVQEVRRHLAWYGGRHRFVALDRHVHAKTLINQIVGWREREERAAQAELDIKSRRLRRGGSIAHGPADDLQAVAELSKEPSATRFMYTRSNLTDFGRLFLSPSPVPAVFVNQHYLGGLEDLQMLEKQRKLKDIVQFGFEWKSNKFLKPMESAYKDAELFKGQYVGTPLRRPVALLPQVSTRFNVDDSYEGEADFHKKY